MKKLISILVVIIGIASVVYGCAMKIPGTQLTTYASLDGHENYSAIEEYVGGDAYNYIIGASLISGEITGVMVSKAVFITVGALIISVGLLGLAFTRKEPAPEKSNQEYRPPNS